MRAPFTAGVIGSKFLSFLKNKMQIQAQNLSRIPIGMQIQKHAEILNLNLNLHLNLKISEIANQKIIEPITPASLLSPK